MSLEFLMVLLALVGFVFLAVWVYAKIFDFVDDWKKERGARTGWGRFYDFAGPPADVEARLPPMTPVGPPAGWDKTVSRSRAGRQEE